ncbi:MAG: Ig-like domain-containing protein [Patescibacteria group bacterium]
MAEKDKKDQGEQKEKQGKKTISLDVSKPKREGLRWRVSASITVKAGGKPAANEGVWFQMSGTTTQSFSKTTDEDGMLNTDLLLPVGTYTITAKLADGKKVETTVMVQEFFSSGTYILSERKFVDGKRLVVFTVKNKDNEPVSRAVLQACCSHPIPPIAATNVAGETSLDIPAFEGELVLRVWLPGEETANTWLNFFNEPLVDKERRLK